MVLDPGMAFGTGHHETTRMCLELLDECVQRGDEPSVLDLGTGSVGLRTHEEPTGLRPTPWRPPPLQEGIYREQFS